MNLPDLDVMDVMDVMFVGQNILMLRGEGVL